jgi:hypothetical protein
MDDKNPPDLSSPADAASSTTDLDRMVPVALGTTSRRGFLRGAMAVAGGTAAAGLMAIMFVAAETIRQKRNDNDLTSKAPWVIAFAFGLLHGLGFGGALKEIGLPQSDVPLALFSFNLGVEAGQLLFVLAVLGLKAMVDRLLALKLAWARTVTGYGVGSMAAVWFIQRVALML